MMVLFIHLQVQRLVNITATNDIPTIGGVGNTAAFTEGTAVVIDNNLTVGDVDSAVLKSATVQDYELEGW